ncbi:hypothetical protein [Acinetobacter indicus]
MPMICWVKFSVLSVLESNFKLSLYSSKF